MKNKALIPLCILCCSFLTFLLGVFIGRNFSSADVILTKLPDQTAPTQTVQTTPQSGSFPININTADVQQLQQLPGIGEVLAQRIIAYREENGPFETVSQLTMVSGIGPERLDGLLDYATVGGSQ